MKTIHKKSVRVSFFLCLSKTEPCKVVSSQISSKFTQVVVYYILCITLLAILVCECCQLSRILTQSDVSDNRGF